jgi:hypothetical protein
MINSWIEMGNSENKRERRFNIEVDYEMNDSSIGPSSASNGGGIYCYNNMEATLSVNRCNFSSCVASTGHGGGIYSLSFGRNLIHDSRFMNCNTTTVAGGVHGGGIYCYNVFTQNEVINNYFFQCKAGDEGGGCMLYVYNGTESVGVVVGCGFHSCVVIGNSGSSYGGGLTLERTLSQHNIINCWMINCVCTNYGGGFGYFYNNDLDCDFDLFFLFFFIIILLLMEMM